LPEGQQEVKVMFYKDSILLFKDTGSFIFWFRRPSMLKEEITTLSEGKS
jgi:hypothetical protein